ncbi:Piso0_002594 [Millerozyma farinosa CBS 7064]|uniref:Piso0_002594 protein n=1 Tax=Pichia sorbitophila (strain ATCC MYA-4447 / BCRC 22081 / CBS 7064 / NBRC 10061 / NRRL Y-12695) TaxID=559304 RepID=G8YD12_PICSO|nr:Piso0_002594 [Millerozyma farinosa CBS 7064]
MSVTSESILRNEYDLAMKFFVNKNFEKSYKIIENSYNLAFREYPSGFTDDSLFIKILCLYYVEIGILINPSNHADSFLTDGEIKQLEVTLRGSQYLDKLCESFGDINHIPSEVLYNLFLLYSVNGNVVRINALKKKFYDTIEKINWHHKTDDLFSKKLLDYFVFHILPGAGDFDEAKHIIAQNPLYSSSVSSSTEELEKIKLSLERQRKEEAERNRKLEEKQKKLESQNLRSKEQKSKHYKPLNELRKTKLADDDNSESKEKNLQSINTNFIITRIKYLIRLIHNQVNENSLQSIGLMLLVLVFPLVFRRKSVQILGKLKDTIKMAVKISYV